MKVTRTPSMECSCGKVMDATTGAGHEKPPVADDLSICFHCGRIWIFNADLSLHDPTASEMHDIQASPAWEALQLMRDLILKKDLL